MIGEAVQNWSGKLAFAPAVDPPDNSVWEGWGSVILVCGIVFLVGAIIVILLWQGMKYGHAHMELQANVKRDESLRQLADRATIAQERWQETQIQVAAAQQRIADDLAEMRAQITSMERMMREVG